MTKIENILELCSMRQSTLEGRIAVHKSLPVFLKL